MVCWKVALKRNIRKVESSLLLHWCWPWKPIFPLYDLKSRAGWYVGICWYKINTYINIQCDENKNLTELLYSFKKEQPVYFFKTLFNNSHIVCTEFKIKFLEIQQHPSVVYRCNVTSFNGVSFSQGSLVFNCSFFPPILPSTVTITVIQKKL